MVALSAGVLHCLSPVGSIGCVVFTSGFPVPGPVPGTEQALNGQVSGCKKKVKRGIGNEAAPASNTGSALIWGSHFILNLDLSSSKCW